MLRSGCTGFLLLLCFFVTAQTTAIRGRIIDKESKKQVAGATILLLDQNRPDAAAAQTLADSSGVYLLNNLHRGRYLMITSCIGYRNDSTTVDLTRKPGAAYTLDIALTQQGAALREVEVSAQKPTILFDRGKIIFDVKQTSFTTASNAWDLLPKSPGVETQGTSISILGKPGASVLVNGRPTYLSGDQLATYLKSISGDQIDQIEIIQHPGVKYDLGQGSGIINIVLKRNQAEGFNGSVTTGYGQGEYNNYNSSTNLNYRRSNFNIYGSFAYAHRLGYIDQPAYIDYTQSPDNPAYFSEDQHSKVRTHSFNFTTGIDYTISKKSSAGFFYNGSIARSNTEYHNNTKILDPQGAIDSSVQTTSTILAPNNLNLFNLNYTLKPDSRNSLVLNADYGHYRNSNSQDYQFQFSVPSGPYEMAYSNTVPGVIKIEALSLDYTLKLSKSLELDAGLKSSAVHLNDDFSYYGLPKPDSSTLLQSDDFRYDEHINAAYISMDKKLPKGNVQLGLRLENTAIKKYISATDNGEDSSYLKVLPSVSYNQDLSPKSSVSLSYSTSFERPSYSYLTPFAIQRDPYSYTAGNPFLAPSYQNSFEVDYILAKKYIVSAEYDDIENRMEQWVEQNDTTKQLANIITNIRNNYYYRLYFVLPITVKKWWTSNNTLNNYIIRYKTPYLGGEYDQSKFVFYWSSLNSFILGPTTSLDLYLYYRTPSLNGLYHIGTRKYADIAFRKSLWKKRASLVLSVSDIFHSNKWVYAINYQDQHSGYTYTSDSRIVKLSFTYKFGRTTIKSPKKVQTGIGSEKSRL
jgi:iron complex outermembrane recepter protein